MCRENAARAHPASRTPADLSLSLFARAAAICSCFNFHAELVLISCLQFARPPFALSKDTGPRSSLTQPSRLPGILIFTSSKEMGASDSK